jgi:rfaE bifunctional protein kinase chain/domain
MAQTQPQIPAAADLAARIAQTRILVVGDLMLDRYLWGRVERISPEAPVPVVDVAREDSRPGGAANVAANLHALGVSVRLLGTVGDDVNAERLRTALSQQGLPTDDLLTVAARPTTTKTRIIASDQHILRVDQETTAPLGPSLQDDLAQRAVQLLTEWAPQAVVIEDYDKGLLSPPVIAAIVTAAHLRQIPVLVDPKFRQFFAYSGCTVFKPNVRELNQALGLELQRDNLSGLARAARQLRMRMPHAWTFLTLSEQGVLLVDEADNVFHTPAWPRTILDVSGAGDTVIAVLAAAIAAGLDPIAAAPLANLAGGMVCEHVGVVPIDSGPFYREAIRLGLLGH